MTSASPSRREAAGGAETREVVNGIVFLARDNAS
jgi:hypothetical protein